MFDWIRRYRAQKRENSLEGQLARDKKHQEEVGAVIRQRCKNLSKNKVAVYIRGKDGGKSYFESEVIGFLLRNGVSIEHVREDELKKVVTGNAHTKGLLVISGIFWMKDEEEWCDFRVLLSDDGEKTEVKSAGYVCGQHVSSLSLAVVMHAAMFLDPQK